MISRKGAEDGKKILKPETWRPWRLCEKNLGEAPRVDNPSFCVDHRDRQETTISRKGAEDGKKIPKPETWRP
jgi:hypothetical protein